MKQPVNLNAGPQVCFACMRWHLPPVPCDHNSDLPCFSCGKPRGMRWNDKDGNPAAPAVECWQCWWDRMIATGVQIT